MTSGESGDASGEGANKADPLPAPPPDLGASPPGRRDTAQIDMDQFGEPEHFGQYPGCQFPGPQPQPFGRGSRTNPLAMAALVCGIGQFLLGLLIVGNILLAIPALLLGVVGLRQVSRRGERGRGMAIAGIVLGALGIIYFALVLILIVAGLSGAFRPS